MQPLESLGKVSIVRSEFLAPTLISVDFLQGLSDVENSKRPSSALSIKTNKDKQRAHQITSTTSKVHRSYSFIEKADDIDDFEFIDTGLTFGEFEDFETLVNDLNLLKNDEVTESNNLSQIAVFSSLLERPILNEINIKLLIKHKQKQISIQSAISCSVEHILYEALVEFQMFDSDSHKYLFKIHGLEEYLPMEAILCELQYIQNCLTLSKDPTFILIDAKNINKQLRYQSTKILFKHTHRYESE
jgi:hypothetical protein